MSTPRTLDPGHRLLDVATPRRMTLGWFYGLSCATRLGVWGFFPIALGILGLLLMIGLDLGDVAVFGRLAEDPDARGIDKLGPYVIPALGIVVGLFGLGRFLTTRRRHFSFLRLGQAVVGEILEVAVITSDISHRRSSEVASSELLDKGTADMAHYSVDYRYEWEGARYEGHDEIDTRRGNHELCQLPRPAPGDRLTVLLDATDPEQSVLALGIAAGLEHP